MSLDHIPEWVKNAAFAAAGFIIALLIHTVVQSVMQLGDEQFILKKELLRREMQIENMERRFEQTETRLRDIERRDKENGRYPIPIP